MTIQFIVDLDRDNEQFNRGVLHTVDLLAKLLGVDNYVGGDGSEDYDEDLQQTMLNVLTAKRMYDIETGAFAQIAATPSPAALETYEHLPNAQRLCADCVARGRSNKEIARDMGNIAEGTVKVHVKMLMNKFKTRNRTELAVLIASLPRSACPQKEK